ncbi:MAG: alanine--tRNA ligase, partial [Planctomycetota bacterium]
DLEDVGHDTYHHTFFEMLGNWSFGDYFKAEAIEWAWELLTDVWGLPKDRLYATVFGGDEADGLAADDEAAELWRTRTDIDPDHILRFGKKDNFWEMGDTGPCGPCTEIHIDMTDDLSGGTLINADDPRVIEIWNLVFIQFNRDVAGTLTPLPAKHVDTGMGFERITAVLQGVHSNYDTDIFTPLFDAIARITGAATYGGKMNDMKNVAYRVVADHIRALTFAFTDGARPSNEGRGYVLRRILRRAARYGRQYLDTGGEAFLCKLVPTIVEQMGEAFPDLKRHPDEVAEIIRDEEVGFNKTLDRGIALFETEADKLEQGGKTELPGDVAFELYATFGFPVDLTALMARERGLTVDMDGYHAAMAAHRATSAAGGGAFKVVHVAGLPETDESAKYDPRDLTATVLGWVGEGRFVTEGAIPAGEVVSLVTDRTNFYAESGGQVGDAGTITTETGAFVVHDTHYSGACVLHTGEVDAGTVAAGQTATLSVDPSRLDTMRNHTTTHLLNWALREVLGEHVDQKGSEVDPDRLRFDFAHPKAVTDEQLAQVERLVNEQILADRPVGVNYMPLDEAMKLEGVRAVFGEKYPDPVRVVSIGTDDPRRAAGVSVEFCGGAHLGRTAEAGLFKVVSEEAVAKGVRRITALTGRAAVEYVRSLADVVRDATAALKVPPEQLGERIAAMQAEIKTLRKKLESGGGGGGAGVDALIAGAKTIGDVTVVIGELQVASVAQLRSAVDQIRQTCAEQTAVFVGWTDEGKVTLIAAVTDAVIQATGAKAGDWVRAVAPVVGGGGGGKPQLAQAGGKQPDKLPDALDEAGRWIEAKLA